MKLSQVALDELAKLDSEGSGDSFKLKVTSGAQQTIAFRDESRPESDCIVVELAGW